MKDIIHNISGYDSISLAEIEEVKLLERMDTKLPIRFSDLAGVLAYLHPHYRVLEIEGSRIIPYRTVYFDTSDHKLYLQHHNGKLNRYKVRMRQYENTGVCFFELKFKSNKYKTVKSRIRIDQPSGVIDGPASEFLMANSPFLPENLGPSLNVFFDRITLVNRTQLERVTIDFNLRTSFNGTEKTFKEMVIVESKMESHLHTPLLEHLKDRHYRNLRISKYCLGIAMLHPELKHNRFNNRIHQLNKMLHDHPSGN